MASNGGQPPPSHFACKCLNIQIHPQPNEDTPPPVETGFKSVYVGEEGICVTHPEVTLRSRSRAIPSTDSPTAELSRFTTVTCLVCGLLTYRVAQQVTPDLSTEEGPVLPTDDWAEKELCKSSTGWIEVFQDSLVDDDIAQAESSTMYSKLFQIVLPGSLPPSAASQTSEDEAPEVQNARGPSEQGKKHLPELPALFLPPPFTPSNVVFRHFSTVATEQSQRLRDEAEEYIAQVTERKVTEVLTAEAALGRQVNLIWNRFRENLVLQQQVGTAPTGVHPVRRRSSVSGHVRTVSNPTPGASSSVRISHFIPTPTQSTRSSPNNRPAVHSALSASLKTSGMHYPGPAHEVNGNGNGNGNGSLARLAGNSPPSSGGSSTTHVHSPSIASSRTIALFVDAETSIREAYRREMDESKDMATSFRYTLDLEAQMEQQRLQVLAEEQVASPAASTSSPAPPQGAAAAVSAGHSPRVHRSAIKNTAATDRSTSPKGKSKDSAEDNKEGKGKRKVTFDVKPDVAIINKDEGEISSEQLTPQDTTEDGIFDMDNESEHSATSRVELPAEQLKSPPPLANAERVRSSPRPPHSRSSSNSGLPPQLQSLRPASLPVPSTMRPPPARHVTPPSTETAERTKALRASLVTERPRPEVVETPVDITLDQALPDGPCDPREEEILRLVAASTPSHRSAWKKNSKAWQVFLSRRERKAGEAGPEAIMEESNYVLDDFDTQLGRRFNDGVADSDGTDDDDGEDGNWSNGNDEHPVAQSLPIPIGLNQHIQRFGVPAYQQKTSLSDRPGLLVPALRQNSSSSLRRASYAERDRVRPMDPGALDFAGDDEYDDDVDSDPETGGKARQRALKILKARNELPAAGMWRSLA